MKRLWWWIIGGIAVIGVIVVIILLAAPKNPIPGPIKKQVTSTLLVPSDGAVVDRQSVKYDPTQKLLSFNVAYATTKLVVSEQPTPDQFVDIPAVYTKLIDGLNNYESFDAGIGTVHLTKPKELNGKEAAVLNTKGTLMFVKPDANLTSDQWRTFFNHMAVVD